MSRGTWRTGRNSIEWVPVSTGVDGRRWLHVPLAGPCPRSRKRARIAGECSEREIASRARRDEPRDRIPNGDPGRVHGLVAKDARPCSTHGARNRSRDERVRRDSRWHHRRTRAPASMASREVDEGNTAKGVPAWGAWALTQPTGQAPGGLRSTKASCSSRRRRSGRTVLEPVDRAAGRDEGRPRSVVSGKGSSSSRGRGGSKHRGQTSRETAPAMNGHRMIITRDGTCEQRVHPPLLPSERELAGAV